jgi:hypothetical protein
MLIQIRANNLVNDGDPLLFNEVQFGSTMDQCWSQMMDKSNYAQRVKEVEAFNRLALLVVLFTVLILLTLSLFAENTSSNVCRYCCCLLGVDIL